MKDVLRAELTGQPVEPSVTRRMIAAGTETLRLGDSIFIVRTFLLLLFGQGRALRSRLLLVIVALLASVGGVEPQLHAPFLILPDLRKF